MKKEAFSVIAAKLEEFFDCRDCGGGDTRASEVKTVALLTWEGYLTTLNRMHIVNMDITDIPQAQMEKFTSILTQSVFINNMTPISQLRGILVSVKCHALKLLNMKLSEADSQALVTAMRNRVETVGLGYIGLGNITLDVDVEELTKYDGRGHCRELEVWGIRDRARLTLRRWAAVVGWTVTEDNNIRYLSNGTVTTSSMFRLVMERHGRRRRRGVRTRGGVVSKKRGGQRLTSGIVLCWQHVGFE